MPSYAEYRRSLGSMEARMMATADQSPLPQLQAGSTISGDGRTAHRGDPPRGIGASARPATSRGPGAYWRHWKASSSTRLVSGERRSDPIAGRRLLPERARPMRMRPRIAAVNARRTGRGNAAQVLAACSVRTGQRAFRKLHAPADRAPGRATRRCAGRAGERRPLVVTDARGNPRRRVNPRGKKIAKASKPRSLACLFRGRAGAALLGVCVVTVLSILRPVQRLIAATQSRRPPVKPAVRVPPCEEYANWTGSAAPSQQPHGRRAGIGAARRRANYRQQLEARAGPSAYAGQHLQPYIGPTMIALTRCRTVANCSATCATCW
jgi:hypothetical protein